ncbi:hypothetical protein MCC01966_12980 [Bifidobacteriaceae bacterium MCC01966]|nr:hypothetical protein MCC01966_12980 [Bifidobacteriaceae bacterium MCC01966]
MRTITSLSKISEHSEIHLEHMPKQAGSYAFDFQLNVPLTHADGDLGGPVCIDASLKVVSRQNDQPQGDGGVCFEMTLNYQATFQEGQSIERDEEKQAVYDAIWPYLYDNINNTMNHTPYQQSRRYTESPPEWTQTVNSNMAASAHRAHVGPVRTALGRAGWLAGRRCRFRASAYPCPAHCVRD